MPFTDLIGHRRIIEVLQRQLSEGRLPHAMLFCGPEGVGKRLMAKHLACALDCTSGQSSENSRSDGCGQCEECRAILEDRHPEVYTIEPDGQYIKIEQIRTLISDASTYPFQANSKIFLLERAHAMQAPAANALLKILEEPPATSLLILITSQPDALLPTIRSRCQLNRFSPLSPAEIATILQKATKCPVEEARDKALWAEGSAGKALQVDLPHQKLLEQSVTRFLELVLQGAPFHQAAELLAEPSKEVGLTKGWLFQFLYTLRQRLVAALRDQESTALSFRQIAAFSAAVDEVRRGLEHNINRPLALENFYLTCRTIATGKTTR